MQESPSLKGFSPQTAQLISTCGIFFDLHIAVVGKMCFHSPGAHLGTTPNHLIRMGLTFTAPGLVITVVINWCWRPPSRAERSSQAWTTECHPLQTAPRRSHSWTAWGTRWICSPLLYGYSVLQLDLSKVVARQRRNKAVALWGEFYDCRRQSFQETRAKPETLWLLDEEQTLTSPSPSLHPKGNTTAALSPPGTVSLPLKK